MAHSEGLGQGSEFVVRLPLLTGAVESTDVISNSDSSTNTETAMRILVVDDNHDSADALVLVLQLDGHVAEAVYNGADALTYAEKFNPDAVLLDIGMPELNGYKVAQRIRKEPWGKNLLLVAQTGWGQEEDILQCREAGFDHHFTKPIDFLKLRKFFSSARTQAPSDR